jgi:[glutamine synthetase] adenylyltransferase / [glutamine synthetase]-adenylyl-L-tyrosine phosphorylase
MLANSAMAGDAARAMCSPLGADSMAAYWSDWQRGEYPSTRSASARSHLSQLKLQLSAAAQSSIDGDRLLSGFDSVVRQAAAGAHLFASLAGNPSALRTLLQLVALAPRLTPVIAGRPDVFDALIADRPSADFIPMEEMARALRALNSDNDTEHFARIQRFTREHQFLIGARAVLGWMPVADAERAHSKLAFAVVHEVIRLVERRLVKLHGRVPGADWALVALGKFGGFELTATSDLDLMLVYQCPDDAPASTGPRCMPATQYFNLLAKNLIAALGAQDSDGPLFEVDFRLRPWGSKGPIATQLSTLRDYLEQESWTYEHMAMTRARVVAGPARFSTAIEEVIRGALYRSAARRQLRTDMLEMHTLVHTAKETKNVWDVKHVRGGMVDIEFIAQYLMLRHANAAPNLIHPATADALRCLGQAGVLAASDRDELSGALSLFKNVLQATRIACVPGELPDTMSSAFTRQLPAMLGEADFAALEAKLGRVQKSVRKAFVRLTRG